MFYIIFAQVYRNYMDFITIIAVALGLSFDTFAVSLSYGVIRNKILFSQAVRFALVMAFFQAGLLVIGYFLGIFHKRFNESCRSLGGSDPSFSSGDQE